MKKSLLFISGVQKEFREERMAIRDSQQSGDHGAEYPLRSCSKTGRKQDKQDMRLFVQQTGHKPGTLDAVWNPLGKAPELARIQNPAVKLDYAKREIVAVRFYEIPAEAVANAAKVQG